MKYIEEQDISYLKNKYHDTSKPFNPFSRFICNDAVFDYSTGMSPGEIVQGILIEDKKNQKLPHSVRKAKAFAYVLEHTRIEVNPHDYFIAIHCINRPLNKTLISAWNSDIMDNTLADISKEMARLERTGAARLRPDYDHSVPVWDRLFALGFGGIIRETEKYRSELSKKRMLTEKEQGYYDAIVISYTAILNLIDRFIKRSEEINDASDKTRKTAAALRNLRNGPPTSVLEVLLMIYIYFICSEHIEGLQVRSLSNLDRVIYPYYLNDIKNGIATESEIRQFVAYFFIQFSSIGNYWNQPVSLGGTKADGTTEINEFSYLVLDVYDKMGIFNPKLQIKLASNTPPEFVRKALDMIRHGHNSIVFVGEYAMTKALMTEGCTEEEARLCDVKGCYEYSAQGALETSMITINLVKPLEYVFHNGKDGISGELMGLQTGEIDEFPSFGDFYAAYLRQLDALIEKMVFLANSYEGYYGYINPQPLLSATVTKSLEHALDVFEGGATHNNTNMWVGFLATIADSLTLIKKHVYDLKTVTLPQLKDALDRNWQGYEMLRLTLSQDKDKYGNNRYLPDLYAVSVANYVSYRVSGRRNNPVRGGIWNVGLHIARMYIELGKNTAASPNGRFSGDELSKNASASMGCNYSGATGQILSVTKLDSALFKEDLSVDLCLLPSAVSGDDGLDAMYTLLTTFEKLGGHAAHFNVFDGEHLRRAQEHPEQYSDLQIRVCGWNALFNSMSKKEQDNYIRQAEALQ